MTSIDPKNKYFNSYEHSISFLQKLTQSATTKLVLVSALVFSLPASLHAENFEQCITFADSLHVTRSLDPSIGVAEGEQKRAEARLKQIQSDWRPRLSSYGRTASGETGLVDGRTENQVGVVLSQRIYDFGQGKAQRKAAVSRVIAASLNVDDASVGSSLNAAITYLDILEAEESLQAAIEREDQLKSIEQGVNRRLETNLITAAEARGIEADRSNATANRIVVTLELIEAEARLAVLTDTTGQVCKGVNNVDAFLEQRMPISLAEAELLMSKTPRLQSAEANRDAARQELIGSSKAKLPVIEAQGVYANIYNKDTNQWDESNRVGLEVSAPLFGGRLKGQRDEAEANLYTTKLTIASLERELSQTTALTWERIKAYENLALTRRNARDSLKQEVQALKKEFNNGLRTYQEMAAVEADLQLAVLQEIEAKYLARQQRVRLLALSNRLHDY